MRLRALSIASSSVSSSFPYLASDGPDKSSDSTEEFEFLRCKTRGRRGACVVGKAEWEDDLRTVGGGDTVKRAPRGGEGVEMVCECKVSAERRRLPVKPS